eukprot:759019-Pleurochrysis_carterae.AAC.2
MGSVDPDGEGERMDRCRGCRSRSRGRPCALLSAGVAPKSHLLRSQHLELAHLVLVQITHRFPKHLPARSTDD